MFDWFVTQNNGRVICSAVICNQTICNSRLNITAFSCFMICYIDAREYKELQKIQYKQLPTRINKIVLCCEKEL